MSDVQPTTTEPWHFAALDCAVAGAEGSAQGALCMHWP